MLLLVAYASRHGATQGIAERIAEKMREAGLEAEARPVASAGDLARYDAFVIGSAAYMFHWLDDATKFVRRHRTVLAERPVWLFSSGPLGTETTDDQGRDLREVSEPREIAELREAVHARDHRVFYGAYDPTSKPIGFGERLTRLLPAARDAFPAGDFRDWPEIDAWAQGIAHELSGVPTGQR